MITKLDRKKLNRHGSAILWFTGFSGSGKSTLAYRLEEDLFKKGVRTYVLDGDHIGQVEQGSGFSAGDREENIRRIGEVAKLFVDARSGRPHRFYLSPTARIGRSREAYANFSHLGMLWSIGKDSTVLLWLTR